MADTKNIWSPGPPSDDESFFRAPLGTDLPQTAVDELAAEFEGHGVCGEDGYTNNVKRDVTRHRDFAGKVCHVTQDGYEETIQITFYEQNPVSLGAAYGDDNVTVSYTEGHRQMFVGHGADMLPRQSFVARVLEGERTATYVVPEGQITEIDQQQLRVSQIWMITVTLDCYKPSPNDGLNVHAVNVHYDEPDVEEPGS